jgi:hypothetical protein
MIVHWWIRIRTRIPLRPKSSGSDRIQIHNTDLNTKCHVNLCVLAKMNFKCMLVSLFRHIGIFLLEDLSTPGSLFSHTFPKNTLNIKRYAFRLVFFVSKTLFLTSLKLIFSFLFHFNSFRCFLVKHNKFW